MKLGLPERMEQRGHGRPMRLPRSAACRRHISTASCAALRASASAPKRRMGPSRSPLKADAPTGRPRLRQKVQIVVAQYWQPLGQSRCFDHNGQTRFRAGLRPNVVDWRRDHAEAGALFDSYLAQETLAQAPAIVAALDLAGVESVADIGGGYGGLLAALLQANPDLARHPVRPPAPDRGGVAILEAQGVADRVQRIGGDLLDRDPSRSRSLCARRRAPAMGRCEGARNPRQLPQGDAARGKARHRRAAAAGTCCGRPRRHHARPAYDGDHRRPRSQPRRNRGDAI